MNDPHTPEQVDHSLIMMDEVSKRTMQVCKDMFKITVFRDLPSDLQIKAITLGSMATLAAIALEHAHDADFAKGWLQESLAAAIITAELAHETGEKLFEPLREPFKKRGLQ